MDVNIFPQPDNPSFYFINNLGLPLKSEKHSHSGRIHVLNVLAAAWSVSSTTGQKNIIFRMERRRWYDEPHITVENEHPTPGPDSAVW